MVFWILMYHMKIVLVGLTLKVKQVKLNKLEKINFIITIMEQEELKKKLDLTNLIQKYFNKNYFNF